MIDVHKYYSKKKKQKAKPSEKPLSEKDLEELRKKTREKIVFVIWIVFTLVVTTLFFSCRKKEMPTVSRSPLYEKTKQRVDDFYAKLDKEQLTPWIFFNTGKISVEKYYGGTIYLDGEFSGSKKMIFWDGFIEPYLEHGIVEILEQVADDALSKQLNPEPCIGEAAGLLDGVIGGTYNRMSEIDQRLRGKGNPESVKRKDVTEKIEEMLNYLQRHKESFLKIAASKYQYSLNVESRLNTQLRISVIALVVSIVLPILIAVLSKVIRVNP
jgi:hypothetical protein